MQNEAVYFYSFIYLSSLALVIIAGLAAVRVLIRKGRHGIAWAIALGVIAVDLAVYGHQALQFVTQPRSGMTFSEKKSGFVLPANRQERLYFDDLRFRYFRPALYQKFTAFDLSTLDYFTVLHGTGTSPSLIISQILDGQFPFQEEVRRLSVADFIMLGQSGFDHWTDAQRLAYFGVMEAVLEDILQQPKFYAIFSGFDAFAREIKVGIRMGYLEVLAKEERSWKRTHENIARFEKLLQLNLSLKPEVAGDIYDRAGERFNPVFVRLVKEHNHLYKEMPAADYLAGLWYKYHLRDVNTFVRFKDYDRIANLFERPVLGPRISAIRSRIRKDFAITAPFVRFFPQAETLGAGEYYLRLSRGTIDDDRLYLEGGNGGAPVPGGEIKERKFTSRITRYDPNHLSLVYESGSSGYIYFSDGYDRHWKASVNGVKTKVFKANGAFKAVAVPSGTGKVEFTYDPVFFRFTLWIYYFTAAACLIYLCLKPFLYAKPRA